MNVNELIISCFSLLFKNIHDKIQMTGGIKMAATTRSLKNRVPISSTVDKAVWEDLQNLSKSTRINISKLLDEAISDLLKKYQKQSN